MNENEILEFNPSSLSIYEDKQKPKTNYNFFDIPQRTLNYPANLYIINDFDKPKNYKEVVVWVWDQMYQNSVDAKKWLMGSQFQTKSEKNTTAHNNKKQQILTKKFKEIIMTKSGDIISLASRFEEKCNVYEFPYDYYKKLRQSFVDFLLTRYIPDETTKQQLTWFVDGIFKNIMSATWDYDHLQYLLEDNIYSKTYIFDNGKWVKC